MTDAASSPPGPRERRLVFACLVGRGREVLAPLLQGVDWDRVLALAGAVRVVEAVAHALLAAVALELPGAVRARLAELSAAAAARNALALHELARAQEVLSAAGVPSAALKGAALLAAHHPSIAARQLGDVDLLVRPRDLARAAAALAAAGVRAPGGALPSLDGSTGPLSRNPGSDHLRALETWGGFCLELHDRLPGGGPGADEVVAGTRLVEWQGRPLVVPSVEDLAGMLCCHVLVKHGGDEQLRARHVADLAAMESSGPLDWDAVAARWRRRGERRAVQLSRALLEAARSAADGRADPAGWFDVLEGGPTALERLGAEARELAGTLRGPGWFRSAFPSRRYLEERFGLRRGSPWTPLLYPWRLAAGLAHRLVRR